MGQGLVLIADDNVQMVTLMDHVLRTDGYRVVTAVGRQSLPAARYWHPDVILLDLHMPDMDGVQVSQHLKADPATAQIPIVAMAPSGDLAAVVPAMPCEDYLSTPFNATRLLATVARWMPAA